MIKVEGLTKRYARFVAVDNISFEVDKGQIVGFLGPNGAGKTTTMRMLTCFMPPTSGTAQVAGFDIQKSSLEVKKRIGYLPETPPVYPDMEVHEYLDFVAKIKGVDKTAIGSRIDDAMQKTDLGDVRFKQIGKLSKGYRQRVGIAQAILHNPDVLILDEPTAGLDPHQIIEARELIKGLAGEHTIILSTHILPEVEAICQNVVIVAKGKLVATDTVANLTSRLRGAESIAVEVVGGNAGEIKAKLETVEGVASVSEQGSKEGLLRFMVESAQGAHPRPEIAKAVIQSGWGLNELHSAGLSLEEIFLQLTGTPATQEELHPAAAAVAPEQAPASEGGNQ